MIIVKANLKARGFTEFTGLALLLQLVAASGIYEAMPSGKKEKSLKNKYSLFFCKDIPEPEPEPESSVEKIYPSLSEMLECSLKETRQY